MAKKGKDRKKKQKRGSRSGGRLSGMRSGMKSFVGTGSKKGKQESTLSKVIWYVILAAAVGFVVYYRFLRN